MADTNLDYAILELKGYGNFYITINCNQSTVSQRDIMLKPKIILYNKIKKSSN